MARSECSVCEEVFASVSGFDKHRVGSYTPDNRHCLSPKKLEKMGWGKDKRGHWRLPGHAFKPQ